MVFDGVGSVVGRMRSVEARVQFADGSRAAVNPKLKVFTVTAPNGQTCALDSPKGAPYLASMCDHKEVVDTFRKHLGGAPWELAGQTAKPPKGKLPPIASIKLVDRYV